MGRGQDLGSSLDAFVLLRRTITPSSYESRDVATADMLMLQPENALGNLESEEAARFPEKLYSRVPCLWTIKTQNQPPKQPPRKH